MMFMLTAEEIVTQALIDQVENQAAGAVVLFEGRVRDHSSGRRVTALEYEVYDELASREGQRIIAEAGGKFNILAACAVHRYGLLALKDVSVSVVVVAAHRDDAFLANRYVIDEIKKRLPIWKKEYYADADAAWVGCPTCSTEHVRDAYIKIPCKEELSWT